MPQYLCRGVASRCGDKYVDVVDFVAILAPVHVGEAGQWRATQCYCVVGHRYKDPMRKRGEGRGVALTAHDVTRWRGALPLLWQAWMAYSVAWRAASCQVSADQRIGTGLSERGVAWRDVVGRGRVLALAVQAISSLRFH